jgi:phosphate transport system protein
MLVLAHTRTAFDSQLQGLSLLIAEMGGLVEGQIVEATAALSNRDAERARQTIATDALIDRMQRAVEEKAIETIACHQPVAVDLRGVIGILRVAGELERIGDLAKNIAKRAGPVLREHMPRRSMGGFRHMTTRMLAQLRDALDSFVNRDVTKAVDVWTRDQELDRLYTSLFRELLTYMMEDPGTTNFGVHLVFCAKNLERMGDHTTNIAEAVYYMVQGESLGRERPKADITPSTVTNRAAAL